MPATRAQIAPLLRVYEPDLALCAGFPWKIPADAIAVPRHGIVNGHPSLLPRYRGPSPVSWAIRNGETGDRLHVPLHGRRARHRRDPRPGQDPPRRRALVGGARADDGRGDHRHVPGRARAGRTRRSRRSAVRGGRDLLLVLRARVRVDRRRVDRARRSLDRCARGGSTRRRSGERGALLERDGEKVRVLRVSREPGDGPPLECADGTLWIVEEEAA